MDGPGSTGEQSAACAEDRERIRALNEALRKEREERLRIEQVCEEAGKLVHSLNNVLSIVATYSASLTDEVEPGHASRDSVDEVARAARRAVDIARKLTQAQRSLSTDAPPDQGRA
jgi:hypothetical protein